MILDADDSLQILLAGATTTTPGDLFASYVQIASDGSTFAPASASATTNGTTAVTLIAAAGDGLVRQVKYLSIYNADTAAMIATLRIVDNGTNRILGKFTLAAGERLEYRADSGFSSSSASASSSTQGRHAVYIAAGSMSPSASGGCASLATIASAASQPDIQSLDFDATTQEYAQFSFRMPKSWDEGTVTFAPVWSHASTTTNFGVVFDLQGVAVSNDDTILVNYGTAQISADTGGTTSDIYVSPESSAITIAGTPAAEDLVFFRISRVTGNGSDTMAVDARLHGITLYITTSADTDA